MYAAMDQITSPEVNLVTLEDPIEYQMSGVNQVQIDERTGITFARGLRSLLRQDPDVILVGEIRDVETARIVMQAAMTGHLVLSTLHTNDAPSAIMRLTDIGVEPFLVSSSVSLIVAQRLIRTVCDRCAEPAKPSDEALRLFGLSREEIDEEKLVAGAGCEACGYTGYRGRTGIFEVLGISRTMRDLIAKQASMTMLSVAARAEGMRSLRSAGVRKALEGITTLDEVVRVTLLELDEGPKCSNCGGEIDSSFVVCPFCRTHLGAKGCPSCGRPIQPDWLACAFCSTPLQSPTRTGRERLRLLVVDDDPVLEKVVQAMFGPDFEVVYRQTGEEGLKAAARERPDVVILDQILPDIRGIEILKKLKESPATSGVPVIMLTTMGDEALEADCLYAGVDDFVRKPFREELLKARITAILRRPAGRA